MDSFPEAEAQEWSLLEAKAWLRDRVDEGARCPCCRQFAKIYKRRIAASSARALLALYREAGTGWAHLPSVLHGVRADEAKLTYWGLIEEERARRADGGRAGWWRVTAAGVDWLSGRSTVPKYAHVYDGNFRKLSGPPVTIAEALGTPFNLEELMHA